MWEATANATAYWFYWFYHNAPAATTWDARFLFWFEGLCCSLAGLLPLPATIRAAFAQLLGEEIFAAKHGGAMVPGGLRESTSGRNVEAMVPGFEFEAGWIP